MQFHDLCCPTLLLSETHFPSLDRPEAMADALEEVADWGFYGGFEIADIEDAPARKRIARTIHACQLRLTVWMSRVLARDGLNLSDLHEARRRDAVARLVAWLEPVAECGACQFALLSGPDPGEPDRHAATEQLRCSLEDLCLAAAPYGLAILLEPLDREVHKKGLIGPTKEATALAAQLAGRHANFGLSWDSGHVDLSGEDWTNSLNECRPYVRQIHLSNPVLDPAHPQYGDFHLPVGAPGVLDVARMAELFPLLARLGLVGASALPIAVEVRGSDDPRATERHCRESLLAAWAIYEQTPPTYGHS